MKTSLASKIPLAERLRPMSLDYFRGQSHLLGAGKLLSRLLAANKPTSLIFWGAPGTGKTTLARLLVRYWQTFFVEFSAAFMGLADIRRIVIEANIRFKQERNTIVLVDEIHHFNKAQQNAFLPYLESGAISLLGTTTENPSFEIIPALLSRCQLLVLNPIEEDELEIILNRALANKEQGLGKINIILTLEAKKYLISVASGDARQLLNILETAVEIAPLDQKGYRYVDLSLVEQTVGKKFLRYDKAGEEHYNLASALLKSLRGSDPDAALYWLACMLEVGEYPHYIIRLMMRFASEDIGLADPEALNQVVMALQAFDLIGMPNGALALAQAVIYLAMAPKSNALYTAFSQAQADARNLASLNEIPLHIRNASTSLMKSLGYGKGYEYPYNYEKKVVVQEYLPERLRGRRYYYPTSQGKELFLRECLQEVK